MSSAPRVFIAPCRAKLARTRAANAGSAGAKAVVAGGRCGAVVIVGTEGAAGDGGDRPVVEMSAEGCPRVHLLGSVSSDQVKELLASSDLFVYPSQYPEGFPTVLLEAGAAGCPVLSFPVAGVRELLAHGGGWIVDDLGEAQSVIRALAEDPQHAAASGRQLRETAPGWQ